MRKSTFLIVCVAVSHSLFAQWTTSGSNVYYNGGNVGIGTTSPGYLFQIHSSNTPTIAIGGLNQNTNGKSRLYLFAGDATARNGFNIDYNKTASTDRLSFVDGGGIEALTIKNGGNVGLGSADPKDKLHIGNGGSIRLQQTTNAEALFSDINFNTYRDTEPDQVGARIRFRTVANIASGYPSVMKTGEIRFNTKWGWDEQTRMLITAYGNVGIGTIDPQNKLDVNGTVHAREVKVDLSGWPDYVFQKDYELMPLAEVEEYIIQNHRLPEMPSAEEVEHSGVLLGEMNKLLLQKLEEVTLHLIEQGKQLKNLNQVNINQQSEIEKLKSEMK